MQKTIRRIGPLLTFFILIFSSCKLSATSGSSINSPQPELSNSNNSEVKSIEKTNAEADHFKNPQDMKIWTGRYAEYDLVWTTRDLTITTEGTAIDVFSQISKQITSAYIKAAGPSHDCEIAFKYKILSVVFPIISIEATSYVDCSDKSSPSFETYLLTFDIRTVSKSKILKTNTVHLQEIFDEKSLLQSLINLAEIRNSIPSSLKKKEPRTLAELQKVLRDIGADGVDGTGHILSRDAFARFYFERISNDKIIVQMELTTGASATVHPRLNLELSIPDKFRKSIELAASQESGFLGIDAEKIAGDVETEIRVPLQNAIK